MQSFLWLMYENHPQTILTYQDLGLNKQLQMNFRTPNMHFAYGILHPSSPLDFYLFLVQSIYNLNLNFTGFMILAALKNLNSNEMN